VIDDTDVGGITQYHQGHPEIRDRARSIQRERNDQPSPLEYDHERDTEKRQDDERRQENDDKLVPGKLVICRRVRVGQNGVCDADAVACLAPVVSDCESVEPLVGNDEGSPQNHDDNYVQCICPPSDTDGCKLKLRHVSGGELIEGTEHRPADDHSQCPDRGHLDREPSRQFEVRQNRLGVVDLAAGHYRRPRSVHP